jgi:hypothetical protein
LGQKHDANGGLSLVGQWESRNSSNKTGREQRPVTPSNQNYLFKTDELISVQQILTKFSIIFISKTKRLLLETFFVSEFYSSSPITGFLLAGYIGTTLYCVNLEQVYLKDMLAFVVYLK